MPNNSSGRTSPRVVMNGAQRVLVATTAMLAFISFWRAAAVVLNDMGSSAFYAGAISEHFVGKTAPWFILAIMLLSYAVRAVYIESCSMFVRGGVYRVVKEAMGGTLAKFSVSALMFDYILTGPISGVSAGLYLVGLLNELLRHAHSNLYPGVQREGSAHHVRDHGDGGHDDHLVRLYALGTGSSSSALAAFIEPCVFERRARLAAPHFAALYRRTDRRFGWVGPFRPGHERRRDDGSGLSGD